MAKYLIEFIGTFFLVLVIGLTSGNAVAIGAVLAALVYMGGYISGAHYNPAVTLGVLLQKKIKLQQALIYMGVQLLAALVAAAVYQVIKGDVLLVAPGADVAFGTAFLVELIFTFALVSVVLHVAVSKKTQDNNYFGIAIGFVLAAAVLAGGSISGAAYNPAVGLGANLYDWSSLSDNLENIWLYLLGPLAGGVLASLVFGFTQKALPDPRELSDDLPRPRRK